MSFKMKYEVKADYIAKGKRRPGTFITPKFGVLHDTGNPGSTAKNNRDYFNNTPNDPTSASAHTFIDDKVIIESVPATTGKTERAHHVRYQMPQDNALYGDDSNDIGIGVELCFGGKINFEEAYKRYVWYCAYVSYKFGFSPKKWIGHEKLDPDRKTDPTNALKKYGKTYAGLLADIIKEYEECTKEITSAAPKPKPEDIKEADDMLEKAVVINAFPDFPFAELLASRIKAPIYVRGALPSGKIAKEVFVVGGTKDGLQADSFVMLTGKNRFEVAAAVNAYLNR
ncbi:peptidoglycan recognition protein family protein [Fictibacillus sp. 26RED30]|uniref:peptidoglycan recognition protein family protein n=1 Tax=Fictibacillus sp. 26RED30 TaxID=2745877 RepID=UPI0018CCF945|nr:peptidoglycan recognition family protein [Fictibacillus sp. 26RED30]MBH0159894.1 N-acetylmuramoyl-L-alanine amidase [Fictibacillus sp. 26RED30]